MGPCLERSTPGSRSEDSAARITPSQIGILNFIILAYSFKLIWSPPSRRRGSLASAYRSSDALGRARVDDLHAADHCGAAWAARAVEPIRGRRLSRPDQASSSPMRLVGPRHRAGSVAYRGPESPEDKDLHVGDLPARLPAGGAVHRHDRAYPCRPYSLVERLSDHRGAAWRWRRSGTLAAPEQRADHTLHRKGWARHASDLRLRLCATDRPGTTVSVVMARVGGGDRHHRRVLRPVTDPRRRHRRRRCSRGCRRRSSSRCSSCCPGSDRRLAAAPQPVAPAPHIERSKGSRFAKAADALFHTILDPLMDLVQRLRWAAILVLALVLMYRFSRAGSGAVNSPIPSTSAIRRWA